MSMGVDRGISAWSAAVGRFRRRAQRFCYRCLTRSLLVASLAGALPAAEKPAPLPPAENRPLQVREGTVESGRGYVTSDRCRSCHAAQYENWHASFHRTMSQVVSVDTVIAGFDDVELGAAGQRYRLQRRGDGFWVELPAQAAAGSPDGAAAGGAGVAANPQPDAASGRWRRIVQSTGSHHYQLYWYPSGAARELNMLPFVFLREERRWVPRDAVFLQPPGWVTEKIVWNHQCLPCHSTDG